MSWEWIGKSIVLAIHEEQIAEHGGQAGIRDEGLLESALAKPVNQASYQNAKIWDLAAAYGYGISRNHPFVDGNKRTSFVAMELFLVLNGYDLNANDADSLIKALALSDGSLTEKELAAWLEENTTRQ